MTRPLMRADIENAATFLFVPGTREDRYEKAARTGADVVIIDLEDAVAPEDKDVARSKAAAWLSSGGQGVVRVNGVGTQWFERDLSAVAGAAAIVLPKTESAEDVEALRAICGREVAVIPLIETPEGVLNARGICAAPGVVRVSFGNVDFAAQIGCVPSSHVALAAARSHLVYASAAARCVAPIDGVTTAIHDVDQLMTDTSHARELGFTAKLLVHPSQVEPVAEALRPTVEELTWARDVLATVEAGVAVHDGNMVDEPVLFRARRLLQRGHVDPEHPFIDGT